MTSTRSISRHRRIAAPRGVAELGPLDDDLRLQGQLDIQIAVDQELAAETPRYLAFDRAFEPVPVKQDESADENDGDCRQRSEDSPTTLAH